MIKPRCLIGAHDSRDSFQADFAALRKWLPRNPQVKGPSTASDWPAVRSPGSTGTRQPAMPRAPATFLESPRGPP